MPEVQTLAGAADGLRIEIATGDLVMLRRGTIVARWKATGQYTTGDVSVDADGVTDIAADSVGTAEVDDDSLTGTDVLDGSLLDADLSSKLLKDLGAECVGYLDLTGVTSDTETVTINGRVYEFDTDSTITGDVDVDVSGGASATQSATALAAAINGDASRDVDAIDVGDGTVLLVAQTAGATDFALATTCANGVVSAATCVGAAAAAVKSAHHFRRTLTAQDVTTTTDADGVIPVGAIALDSAPSLFVVQVRDSNGVLKACANVQWSWQQANSNYYLLQALETQAAATDFAASDTVDVIVIQ